jgi:hypothetical protein
LSLHTSLPAKMFPAAAKREFRPHVRVVNAFSSLIKRRRKREKVYIFSRSFLKGPVSRPRPSGAILAGHHGEFSARSFVEGKLRYGGGDYDSGIVFVENGFTTVRFVVRHQMDANYFEKSSFCVVPGLSFTPVPKDLTG